MIDDNNLAQSLLVNKEDFRKRWKPMHGFRN